VLLGTKLKFRDLSWQKTILNWLVYIYHNVSEPPEVSGDVPEQSKHTVLLHRRLVLKCPLHGSPPPKITWYKVSPTLDMKTV